MKEAQGASLWITPDAIRGSRILTTSSPSGVDQSVDNRVNPSGIGGCSLDSLLCPGLHPGLSTVKSFGLVLSLVLSLQSAGFSRKTQFQARPKRKRETNNSDQKTALGVF
jgi:hypothetical protein